MSIIVVGAGIVGICSALALADAGRKVILIDRDAPAGLASRWNAGVLSTSSLVPLAAPGLARQVPGLLAGRSPAFRVNPASAASVLPFGLRFLRHTTPRHFAQTVTALNALITLSIAEHRRLAARAGKAGLIADRGWLHLYETDAAHAAAAPARALYRDHGVAFEDLDAAGLADLEPDLAPRFARATWLTGSAAVSEPAHLCAAYLGLLRARGVTVIRRDVTGLTFDGAATILRDAEGGILTGDAVVIAAGSGSRRLLASAGLALPMIAERGYVRRFRLRDGAHLRRPVHDTAGGLVLSPRPEGVQMSTGTELTLPGVAGRALQRNMAALRAARLLPLASPVPDMDADAERPTLPDCRPAIGPVPGRPGLWLCTGHQHIGFATAPGSAALLSALMTGGAPPVAAEPFDPARFGRLY